MEEWKEYKLGDLTSMMTKGISPSYTEVESSSTICVLNQKCNRNFKISFKEARLNDLLKKNVSDERILRDGDVLINSTGQGTAGRVAQIWDIKAKKITVDGHMIILRPKEIMESLFYGYALRQSQNKIIELQEGSTGQTEINRERLMTEITIKVPKIDIQHRISNFFKNLDDKIELNNRINANLEEQAQALFRRWFVDFEFPNKQGLPYKSHGDRFVESELGKIPEGWKIGCIGDYCKVKSGFAFKSNWWTDRGVKVIKIKNINSDNTLNINDCSYVSEDIALLAKDFYVSDGDLLIAMTGATIGKFTIVVSNEKDLLVNQRVGKFFLGEKPLKKLPFIYNVLKQNKISETIINKGQGSAQPNISPNDIECIEFPYSSNILIEKFNETCYPLLYQIIHNQKQNMKLIQLRDTLLPQLMNNQIKI